MRSLQPLALDFCNRIYLNMCFQNVVFFDTARERFSSPFILVHQEPQSLQGWLQITDPVQRLLLHTCVHKCFGQWYMKNITALLRNFEVLYILLFFKCSVFQRLLRKGEEKAQILFFMLIQYPDIANISGERHKEYSKSCKQSHEALALTLFFMIKRY